MSKLDVAIQERIEKMRVLLREESIVEAYEAAILGQTVMHDTIGGSHPIMLQLNNAIKADKYGLLMAAIKGVIALYEQGMLKNPRLSIAREIEGDILDIAQAQVQAAESNNNVEQKALQLAVAAFLAGAAIEDALRRLCDAHGANYDVQKSTISKLQSALYKPSEQIEIISLSENKQITAWADTRNNADHGKFSDITHTETLTMVMGVRSFIEKHLP
jgi:hypothetical protein